MFTEHGKLVRIVAAASGPNAGELRVRARESTIKEQGGRVEGKELAIKAFHDVSRTMETADVDLICGLMTEDGWFREFAVFDSR